MKSSFSPTLHAWRSICLALLISVIIIYPAASKAQDSSRLRISLLTCSPGDELYSIFGHSALRITDSNSVTDIVFNYGTFNFGEKDFYLKFMRGKLLYYLSTENFNDFCFSYLANNRSIREQVLQLTAAEKKTLQQWLLENLREDKKYYLYDFFLDNCTTRLRDLLEKIRSPKPLLPGVMDPATSFRDAIHAYLDKGNKPWSKLGIDILLGAKTDRIMTAAQQQFLPDNLMSAIDSCRNYDLVLEEEKYSTGPLSFQDEWFTPLLFFCTLLLITIGLRIGRDRRMQALAEGWENFNLFVSGILGFILILMWVATDHKMTKDNYNLLWAWPLHLIMVFMPRGHSVVRSYFKLHTVFLILLLLSWSFLPQRLNPALIPFVIQLIAISLFRLNRDH